MVQAAVEGSIDFRSADPRDSRWWTKTLWVTGELARGRHLRYLEQSANHRRALMANSGFEPEDWTAIRDQATETLDRIYANLFPWVADKNASVGTSQHEAERLAKMWEERWGNPSDPAVAAEIDELVAAIEYRAPPPDDEDMDY